MLRKKSIFYIIILLGFAFFGIKALFHPGYYTSHDGWHQVARLYHFDKAVRDGHFPPRWAGGLLHGSGYPLFVFNYHLPWYIAELLVLAGFSIFDAIKATFVIGYLLSGIFMFLWIKDMWGSKSGFIAAFLYLWAPYRFSNIFVRGSLGEATSFVFLPLLFWGIYRLTKGLDFRFILIGAIGIAGIILSHAMMVYLMLIPALLFFLSLLIITRKKKLFVLATGTLFTLGLLLSAYYILPALFYKNITVFDSIMKGYYQDHFVSLNRLIYSHWGYGFSREAPDAMSLQVGIAQWISVLLGIFMVTFLAYRGWLTRYLLPLGILFSFIFSIFMMVKTSQPIWQALEGVIIVDFPWRFLGISVFLASILSGWLVNIISQSMSTKINFKGVKVVTLSSSKVVSLLFLAFLVAVALYTNRNYLRVNQYTDIPLSLYIKSEQTSNTYDEYSPIWADRGYLKKEGRRFLLAENGQTIEDVEISVNNTIHKDFSYNANQSGWLSVNLLSFPGWIGNLDGKRIKLLPDTYGLVKFNAPSGIHHVSLQFIDTPIVLTGKILSLIGVFFSIFFLFKIHRTK